MDLPPGKADRIGGTVQTPRIRSLPAGCMAVSARFVNRAVAMTPENGLRRIPATAQLAASETRLPGWRSSRPSSSSSSSARCTSGRARLALPDQLVDQQRFRPEALAQAAEQIGAIGPGLQRQLWWAAARRWPGRSRAGSRSGSARCRSGTSGPSAAITSAADLTRVAPSRSSWLVPRWRGSSGPGTAMTRACSAARRAVISEPDCGAASTTTMPRLRPEISRLRRSGAPAAPHRAAARTRSRRLRRCAPSAPRVRWDKRRRRRRR